MWNILFIAHDTTLYGANQSLLNMLSSLSESNVKIYIVFPDNGPICKIFDQNNINYKIIKFKTECTDSNTRLSSRFLNFLRFVNKKLTNLNASYKLEKLIRSKNINIIHSNSSVVTIGFHVAKSLNIKHIWHLREYITDNDLSVFNGIDNYRKIINNSPNIISITSSIAQYYQIKEPYVLFDAVRKKTSLELNQDYNKSNNFLFCGSLNDNKGVIEAIRGFYEFNKKIKGYSLYIAGTGSREYQNKLNNLVSSLNIEDHIRFLGFRNDIDAYMQKATALLMCSKHEGLGRVTIEAMFNNCLVIGLNSTGTSEIINDRVTGVLYNCYEDLSGIMIDVATGKFENKAIARSAFDFAQENFTEEVYAEKLLNFYDNLNEWS